MTVCHYRVSPEHQIGSVGVLVGAGVVAGLALISFIVALLLLRRSNKFLETL